MTKLINLLDEYVGSAIDTNDIERAVAILDEVCRIIPTANDPDELQIIAAGAWDKYFSVNVDVMIAILRRWFAINPSKESQHALGSYLLAHGPDWDEEGHELMGDYS